MKWVFRTTWSVLIQTSKIFILQDIKISPLIPVKITKALQFYNYGFSY